MLGNKRGIPNTIEMELGVFFQCSINNIRRHLINGSSIGTGNANLWCAKWDS